MEESCESAPRNRWYVNAPNALPDVLRSARGAHSNSGQPQFVHHHPIDRPCSEACGFVTLSGGDDARA